MADFSSVPTVDLLTRAADAAGRAAALLESYVVSEGVGLAQAFTQDGYLPEVCGLIAASGPDHWRAVKATFRRALETHSVCGAIRADGCADLADLRPLAEQVLRDLGDT